MVKRNVIANTLGRVWSMLMALVFVPVYIKFLGIEAYGLIGFFATLQSIFLVLDLGLSTTLNRELARASAHPEQAQRTADLVRTLEIIYWGIAVLIGAAVIVFAPLIAHHWLNPKELSPHTVQLVVMLIGLVIAFQWPYAFYAGGLAGLQRQTLQNLITSVLATVRGIGAVLVLWLVSPTIEAYFKWQLAVSILGVIWFAVALRRSLSTGEAPARFQWNLLRSIWRFAAGMTGISIVSLLLTQTDKILLSTMLPLNVFGYYTLSGTVASASIFIVAPVFNAIFPRFSQLVSAGDHEQVKALYHRASQLISVLTLPLVLVVAFFSFEIVFVWTGDAVIAERTHWLVSLLVIGTALNGLMHIPYALQLANGWTRLAFTANLIAVLLLVPLTYVLATHFGAIGAAFVWMLLNISYILVTIPVMHRRLLKGEMWHWYRIDIGRPLFAVLSVVFLSRLLFTAHMSRISTLLLLSAIGLAAMTAAVLVTPSVRIWIIQFFSDRLGRREARGEAA